MPDPGPDRPVPDSAPGAPLPARVGAHGGGRLRTGNPGCRGGRGRPSSLLRHRCQESFADRIQFLEDVADGKVVDWALSAGEAVEMPARIKERIQAVELIARYAGLEKIVLETVEVGAETGEAVMARAMQAMGRLLLTAPQAQRLALLQSLAEPVPGPDYEMVPATGEQ